MYSTYRQICMIFLLFIKLIDLHSPLVLYIKYILHSRKGVEYGMKIQTNSSNYAKLHEFAYL